MKAIFLLFSASLFAILSRCGDALPAAESGLLEEALAFEPNEQLRVLRQISDSDEYLLRSFKSRAHVEAASQLQTWMQLAGLQAWTDAIGNVHGEIKGPDAVDGAIVLGSHYDTVRDAGAYDGTLGIVTAIAAVKGMVMSGSNGCAASLNKTGGLLDVRGLVEGFLGGRGRRAHVRVVAFTDEEGMRFHTTFLGSRALIGHLTPQILAATDADGVSVADAAGLPQGAAERGRALAALAMPPAAIRAYVEAHMEQGPVLEAMEEPIGIVREISGQSRLQVQVVGEQGHAGTVPMHLRKDPLRAAARLVDAIGERCTKPPRTASAALAAAVHGALQWLQRRTPPGLRERVASASLLMPPAAQAWLQLRWLQVAQAAAQPYLVCTVGRMDIWPGVSNVIPGGVNFTVDVRSDDDGEREAAEQWLRGAVAAECAAHGMRCGVARLHAAATQHADMDVRDALIGAAARVATGARTCWGDGAACAVRGRAYRPGLGQASGAVPPQRVPPVLTSGAGHDALAMAAEVPMGMVFVRCRKGISHSPEEFVLPEDVTATAHVLLEFLLDAH